MNFLKKHGVISALILLIILILLFILGETSFKNTVTTTLETLPPQTQTAAVSDFNSNLIAHYTFDDGTATDSSGRGNNGTVNGAVSVDGKFGKALRFDGSDDYISIGSNSMPIGKQAITVSAWVKLSQSPSYDSSIVFRGQTYSFSNYVLYDLSLEGSGHATPAFTMTGTGSGGSHYKALAPTTFQTGEWHHLVGVSDGVSTARIYVDGVASSGSHIDFQGHNGTAYTTSIGARMYDTTSSFFSGLIDDVRVYDRALSVDEVQQLYEYADIPDDEEEEIIINDPPPVLPDPPPTSPPPEDPPSNQQRVFYIDYTYGLDTNSGTSKTVPWKRHPYMKGFAGSYTHQAGDRFVFRGGTVWPSSVFQMNITAGGNDENTRDHYGVDKTWYAGNSWTRPIFDFESKALPGHGADAAGVRVSNAKYITFDNLELIRFRQKLYNPSTDSSDPGYGGASLNIYGTASYITVSNSVIRDWSIPTPIPPGYIDGGAGEGGIAATVWSGGGAGIKILNNEFHQQNSGVRSGMALYLAGEVAYNTFHHVSDVMIGGGIVHDNIAYNVEDATDPELHEDVFYMTGPSTLYNNIVYDTTPAAPVYYLEPSRSAASGTTLLYNNVAYNTGYTPFSIDIGSGSGLNHTIKIYNNTARSNGSVLRVVNRGSPLGKLEIANNHFIHDGSSPMDIPTGTVGNVVTNNNLVQSLALAQQSGAVAGNGFRPTSALSLTVNTGTNLSSYFTSDKNGNPRGVGGTWDIGAYEYQGTTTEPPPGNPPPTVYKPGDLNKDGSVNTTDFSLLQSVWNQSNTTYDLTGDGTINTLDYVIMIKNWTG